MSLRKNADRRSRKWRLPGFCALRVTSALSARERSSSSRISLAALAKLDFTDDELNLDRPAGRRRGGRHLESILVGRRRRMKMSSLVVAAGLLLPSCAAAPRQIAITIDDLPGSIAPYPPGVNSLEVNRQMVAALKAGGVPATTFVNAVNVTDPTTMEALEGWRAAGFVLGNHTWSHRHLSDMSNRTSSRRN